MAKKLPTVDFSDSYISIILGFLVVLVGGILLYNFFTKSKATVPVKNIAVNTKVSTTPIPTSEQKLTPQQTITPSKTPTYTPTQIPSRTPTHIPTQKPTSTAVPTKVQIPTSTPLPTPTLVAQKTTPSVKLPAKYTVVSNDTLWSIAQKFYSSGYNWVDIAKENKITNPELLTAGTLLTIPNTKVILPGNATSTNITSQGDILPSAVSTPKTYTVQKGDTLWGIAVKVYADGFAWPKIAEANHLTNPRLIHSGNKFIIP